MNTFMKMLAGTWFIISTNFPMWLDGKKTNPSFTYTISEKNGKTGLIDEVRYEKNGKTKTIKGFDTPDEANEQAFTWRGKGLMAIAKSEWEVRMIDTTAGWAVIWFSKTLFTPEGVDIISRSTQMDSTTLNQIKDRMLEDELLRKHVGELVTLSRQDR